VDVALKELGVKRRIAVRVESFLAAIPIVASTNLILTAPRLVLRGAMICHGSDSPIRMLGTPLSLSSLRLYAYWDLRKDADVRFRWFFSRVGAAVESLNADMTQSHVFMRKNRSLAASGSD
jgi:DNA-binding transcriptional LysR family regulator